METKEKRTKVLVGVLALAGLLGVWTLATAGNLEPSGAPGPTMKTLDEVEPRIAIHASDLPLTITEPGSYYLVEDVNFTDTVNHAITVECDNVTIDLKCYTFKGPDSGSTCGVYMDGRNNVEIRNGTIRDFGWPGIYDGSSTNGNHRVINVRAHSNLYGVYVLGPGNLIKDCSAESNTNDGIYTGNNNMVTGNTCCSNGGEGILAQSGCTVTGNMCYSNGTYGIAANSGCTVTGNTCYTNSTDGICCVFGCTISGNTCYNNSDEGIEAGSGCTIVGNTTMNNTYQGINAGDYCLIDQNTAYGNGTNMSTGTECKVGLNVAP